MVMAAQGLLVLVLDLPTGGLADAFGRKPVLVTAALLNVVSLALFAVASSVALFVVVFLLQGAFRALDSGPLDSWYVDAVLADLRRRTAATTRERIRQLQLTAMLALQGAVAASLSWMMAHDVLDNPSPVFAPAAAVGVIVSSVGQHLRRSVELVIGVVLGVAVGDFLVNQLGTGWWQLGLIVGLAIVIALLVGGRGTLVAQAGSTAVLIAALSPRSGMLEFPRIVDALVGGSIGLAVVILLVPLNPMRMVDRSMGPAAELFAKQLGAAARALAERDAVAAQRARTGPLAPAPGAGRGRHRGGAGGSGRRERPVTHQAGSHPDRGRGTGSGPAVDRDRTAGRGGAPTGPGLPRRPVPGTDPADRPVGRQRGGHGVRPGAGFLRHRGGGPGPDDHQRPAAGLRHRPDRGQRHGASGRRAGRRVRSGQRAVRRARLGRGGELTVSPRTGCGARKISHVPEREARLVYSAGSAHMRR